MRKLIIVVGVLALLLGLGPAMMASARGVTYVAAEVNYAPVAKDVSDSTNEDTLDTWFPVVSDPDAGEILTCSVAEPTPISAGGTSFNGGTVTVESDCSSGTYAPPADFNGADSFAYAVSDGSLYGYGNVTYTVYPVNDAPVANDVGDRTIKDTPDTWLPYVSDPDLGDTLTGVIGDTLTCSIGGSAAGNEISTNGGKVAVASDCSSGAYYPPPGFTGADSFNYWVCDLWQLCDFGEVTYTVYTVNSAPVANDVSDTTYEDTPVDVTLSGADVDNCNLNFSIVSGPSDGVLSTITDLACDGADVSINFDTALVTYTPNSSFNGSDSFIYRVTDGDGASGDATVSITVNASPDTTAPTVSSVTPLDWATNVSVVTVVTAAFSEAMNGDTINTSTFTLFTLEAPALVAVAGAVVSYDAATETATFALDRLLDYDTTYMATVTNGAQDLAGNGLADNYTWRFTTVAAPPPAAPTGLTPSPGDGQVTLNWTPSTSNDVTEQRLYRSTASGGSYALVQTFTDNTTTTYTDTGLTSGTPYFWVVRAFDGTNESANSTEASATPQAKVAETIDIIKAAYNSKKNGGKLDVEATSSLGGPPATSLVASFYVDGGWSAPKAMEYNAKKRKWSVTLDSGDGLTTTKPEKVEVCSVDPPGTVTCTQRTDIGGGNENGRGGKKR